MKISNLEKYFAAWSTVLPLMSFLIIPSIQGTLPTYLMAFLSFGWLPFVPQEQARSYIKGLGIALGAWLLMLLASQCSLHFSGATLPPKLLLVDMHDPGVMFRGSLFTQSLYLFACVMTFLSYRYLFKPEWEKYLFWGAWLLAGYGIYEWTFFLIFQHPGDFISNRSFLGGEHAGSWSQVFTSGGVNLLRVKSTGGEPSFLALTAVPYFFFAITRHRWWLAGALLFGMVFSFSTSVYLGLVLVGAFSLLFPGAVTGKRLIAIAGVILLLAVLWVSFPDIMEKVFEKKLSGSDESGHQRSYTYELAFNSWLSGGLGNKIFGIGFGYTYVTPLLGGILLNTGVLGVLFFLAALIYPLWKLPNTWDNWPYKSFVLALAFALCVSVAEFAYPLPWALMALTYRKMRDPLPAPPREKSDPPDGGGGGGRKKRRTSSADRQQRILDRARKFSETRRDQSRLS